MAAQPDPPPITGYDFVQFLGSGGFGDVFQYRHSVTGASVAVKVLREGAFDHAGREQFEREARALGTLARDGSHPNIVAVHLLGDVDGRPYLITEYCPHGSMVRKMRQSGRRMEPNEVMRLGILIAGALHMAHQVGIVHRDIKPGNILFGVGDVPKLGDFGIAALNAEDVADGSAFLSPHYAAYEVAKWGEADALSDVFSLAATLYEALAGHSWVVLPGADNSEQAIQRRLDSGVVPPIGDAPARLERLLRLAMSHDRDVRVKHVATAQELAEHLHTVQLEMGYPATPIPIFHDTPHQTVQRKPSFTPPAVAHTAQRVQPAPEPLVQESPTRWRRRDPEPELLATVNRPVQRPVEPEPEPVQPQPKRSKWLVPSIAGVVLLAGIATAVMLRPGVDKPSVPVATAGDPGPGALAGAAIPRPAVSVERLDADSVRFTWTYADPQPGDYFRLQRSDSSGGAAQQVDRPEWVIDGVTGRICVAVRLIRADHRAGRETGEACA